MEYKKLTPEQIALINKPLPKEAIKPHPTKPFLSTIKGIYVTDRLNEVFGIGAWKIKTDYVTFGDGSPFRITMRSSNKEEFMVMCKTIFEVPEYGIYYECLAGSSNDDAGDAAKGATTDAITKICSYIGIGAHVYKGEPNPPTQGSDKAPKQPAPPAAPPAQKPAEKKPEIPANDRSKEFNFEGQLQGKYDELMIKAAKLGLFKPDVTQKMTANVSWDEAKYRSAYNWVLGQIEKAEAAAKAAEEEKKQAIANMRVTS